MRSTWLAAANRVRLGILVVGGVLSLTLVLTTVVLLALGQGSAETAANTKPSPYTGLGTWVDMYDWTAKFGGGTPRIGPATVDAMNKRGVQTLEIQAAADAPGTILERSTLEQWVARAKKRGMRVVLWYIPTFVDTAGDVKTLTELESLKPDGIGVDIESKQVADVAERSRRLVSLSQQLRAALPGTPLQAIVLAPVYLEQVTPGAWPAFPWSELKGLYDVWSPMAYWTDRLASSGFRDAQRYTTLNIARLREVLGDATAPIHVIGGIGDEATAASVREFVRMAKADGCIGASLYDWRTTTAADWTELAPIRTS